MDQRTTTIDQDLKDIVHTRVAIAEKLELLEQRIKDTAEGATMKFSQMLDETSHSVNQMVDKTKAALNPIHKVDEFPWLMLGGAIGVGFAIGMMESRSRRSGVYPYYPPGARASRVMPESARQPGATTERKEGIYDYYPTGPRPRTRQSASHRSNLWDGMSQEFTQEAEETKAVLMQFGRSLMLELARKMMPEIARSFGVNLSSQFETGQGSTTRRPATSASRPEGENLRNRASNPPAQSATRPVTATGSQEYSES